MNFIIPITFLWLLLLTSFSCNDEDPMVTQSENPADQPIYGEWTSVDRFYISGIVVTPDSITYKGAVFTTGFGATPYRFINDSTIEIDYSDNTINPNRIWYFRLIEPDTLYWSSSNSIFEAVLTESIAYYRIN